MLTRRKLRLEGVDSDRLITCSFTKEGLEMLMDNTLELLGITDSNIKITRFSAESVNGEKRNVIEARLTYNGPYCESEKVVIAHAPYEASPGTL